MKPPPTLTLSVKHYALVADCPNFHRSGSITGMRRKFYGQSAQLIRCGSYIYNATGSSKLPAILATAR